jgi:hypothetical protein
MIDLYRWLEQYMIQAVCEQLEWTGDFNASALEIIRELQRRGMPLEAVERKIRQVTGMSQAELDKVFDNAVELNNQYYTAVGDKLGLVLESVDSLAMQMEIDAIRMQTGESMRNLTRSMGFGMRGMDGSIVISDVQETYQNILDKAEMKVLSGTESYQEAIRGGVKEMADSGLVGEWVDYLDESGNVYHRNRVDVAVRRAVMTGVTQVSSKYTEAAAQDVDSPLREISAHRGARDIDGPNGWENHKRWQGKVYSLNTGDKYPNIYSATGWGTVTGLEGANCRHMHFLFVEGVSERTYTDAELKKIDRPDFEYQGRKYTAYEATQKQRQIETALRKLKRRRDAFKASGDKDAYTEAQARFRALLTEYKAFSHAADLPEQMFRIT